MMLSNVLNVALEGVYIMGNYKKETEEYLKEMVRLFKVLKVSTIKLEKLIEDGPKGDE